MTWISFISWVLISYFFYFLVNFLFDLFYKKSDKKKDSSVELTFEEEFTPKNISKVFEEKTNATVEKEETQKTENNNKLQNDNYEEKNRKEETQKTESVEKIEKQETSITGGLALKDFFQELKKESIIKTNQINFG